MADRPIKTFLHSLGISGVEQQAIARAVMEEIPEGKKEGFTRPGRLNMGVHKEKDAQEVLVNRLAFHCASMSCRDSLAAEESRSDKPRELLLVEKNFCEVCGGSNDKQALEDMAQAMRKVGLSRIVVVGGTDKKSDQIKERSPGGIEWRFVDGLTNVNERKAKADLKWGDIVIIWGGTPLPHHVSNLYSSARHAKTANGTGITTLAREAKQFALNQRNNA